MSAYAPQRLHIVPQTGHNDFSMGTVRYWLQQTHIGHRQCTIAVNQKRKTHIESK